MRMNKLTLVSACIAGMFLVACGDGKGFSVSQSAAVAELSSQARYQIVLKDAITGNVITDSLSITFTGAADLKAADGTSLNGKTITTTDGVVALGATFSATAKDFSVLAGNRTLGWIETGTSVVGDSTVSGDKTVELLLINTNASAALNASPIPVSMAVATGAAGAGGALSSPVALATTQKTVVNAEGVSETAGSSTLTMPTGTVGTTATGQLAAAGPLAVSATTFSNSNIDSMSAFPGGFAATVVVPASAPATTLNGVAPDQGTFVTGGFAQFNVTDSAGNAIKNFDPPIEVGIDLPKSTLGADGVTPLTVGDEYPIWSFDDATGGWKYEKTGIVAEKTPVDPSNYTVKFSTTHLSSWNLDFYVATCTGQINLTGRLAGDTRQLLVETTGVTGRRFSSSGYITDSQLKLLRAPVGTKVNVKVKDQGVVVGQTSTSTMLCGGAISIPVTLLPRGVGTVRVETSESCADGSRKRAVPTFARLSYGSTFLGGYTTAATGASVASRNFGSIPVAGTKTVKVLNPRSNRYESKSVTVTANTTATAAFNFTMTCGTGATN